MVFRAALLPWIARAALWLALGSVAACAAQAPAPPAAPAQPRPRGLLVLPPEAAPGQRLIVLLAADAADPVQLGERLAAAAQVPVLVLRALGPRRWTLQLQCDGPAACAAALERLAAARSLVQSLEHDAPVQVPPRPSGALAH